jgi:hypothetical protein
MPRASGGEPDAIKLKLAEEVRALAEHREEQGQGRVRSIEERLRDSQLECHRERMRAQEAEAALEVASQQAGEMDCEERLHFLINGEWVRALTAEDRRAHPFGVCAFPAVCRGCGAPAGSTPRASRVGLRDGGVWVRAARKEPRPAAAAHGRAGKLAAQARGRREGMAVQSSRWRTTGPLLGPPKPRNRIRRFATK